MSRLQLTKTDFQKSSNASAHRTADYDTTNMVLRRGQPFTMALTFNRAVQAGDALKIICETGPSASVQKNTRAEMTVSSSGSATAWSAVRGQSSSSVLPLTINVPVNACIGKYSMDLQITSGGSTTTSKLGSVIMLFNAWAKGDEVYMSNEAEKDEYIMNEITQYWAGNVNNFGSGRWDCGQFEEGILDACIAMLDRNPEHMKNPAEEVSKRNDPVYVTRTLSRMVNSNDDKGVVVGNWSGDYSGGVSPSTWNGSVPILRQWMKSGPVKYGQCWVYAGVLCTALRCLGIPGRLIINFESAHDTDGNLTIDTYYDKNGRRDADKTTDSVWNFHAWNEGHFARKDLGAEYDGWQVLDATPQELSLGVYCLGPSPKKAVLEGDINKNFDTKFVFAEVNGDMVSLVENNGGYTVVSTETAKVGMQISTKQVGVFGRKNITNEYKYPEGSDKEREVFNKAKNELRTFSLMSRTSEAEAAAPAVKPEFSGSFQKNDKTQVGEDLAISLKLKNLAAEPQNIKIGFSATGIVYNSTPFKNILTESQAVVLEPNGEKDVPITIPYPKYRDCITPNNMIKVGAVCEDAKGGKMLVNTVYVLLNPKLLIRVLGEAKLHHPVPVDIIFTNTSNEDVKDSVLIAMGSGIYRDPLVTKVETIQPKQRKTMQLQINPYKCGERSLLLDYSSITFPNVKGFESIKVAHS